jgi:hypothetical protein
VTALSTADVGGATDWFELLLITRESSKLGIAKIRAAVESVAPELSDQAREEFADDICNEVGRRAGASGGLYPFEQTETGIARRALRNESLLLYAFLVLCSARPTFRQPKEGWKPGSIFEALTALALARYVSGTAVIFSQLPVPPDTGIRPAIQRLGELLCVRSFPEHARVQRKDHGLDVAAWRDFGDRRAAHPVILCQCALGEKLIGKAREVVPSEWDGLLHLRENTISAGLAVPHALPPDYSHWEELRRNTDLVIERTRLLALLENEDEPWKPLEGHGDTLTVELTAWNTAREPQ